MVPGLVLGLVVGSAGGYAVGRISGGKGAKDGQPLENGGSATVEAAKLLMPGAASASNIKVSLETSSSLASALIQQLWPQINKLGIKIVKESVEPMFAEMLPGPFQKMYFETLDLGEEPLKLENFVVHPIIDQTLRIELEINWDSNCNIQLAGIPGGNKIGIKTIKLRSRLLIVAAPITDVSPLVGSAQVAFINQPYIDLDFTGLANVADWANIRPVVDKGIKDGLAGSLVLPARTFIKVDPGCDFIQAYQRPIGVLRVKLVNGRDFPVLQYAGGLVKDMPDVYCNLELGGKQLASSVVHNSQKPSWNESFDFILSDFGQIIDIHAWDKDLMQSDSDLGFVEVTALDLLKDGGNNEFVLSGQPTDDKRKKRGRKPTSIGKVSLDCKLIPFCSNIASITNPKPSSATAVCGLIIVFVSKVVGLPVPKEEAASHVKINFRNTTLKTSTIAYDAETAATAEEAAKEDEGEASKAYTYSILNPEFNAAFQIPILASDTETPEGMTFELMNGKESLGSFNITSDVYMVFKDELHHSTSNVGGAIVHYGVQALGLDLGENAPEDLALMEDDSGKPAAPLEIASKEDTTASTDDTPIAV